MTIFDDVRADWGALPSTNPVYVAPGERTEFVNHWWGSDLPDLTSHDACYALMRSTQRYHQNTRGFADIGYNGVICAHGRSIEARGLDLIGAHATNHNTTGYGWCFMTPLDGHPTDAMLDRMVEVLADCEAWSGHVLTKLGHRDVGATDCPGDRIEAWVKAGMLSPLEPIPTDEVLWLDYSWARPDTAGFKGVVRYLEAFEKGTRPDLTVEEVGQIHGLGLDLGLYWQSRDASVLEGYDVGVGQAHRANWEADALGVPMHVPIFYVVDEDYSPAQVLGYFDGVTDVLDGRPVGIYGSAKIVIWARSSMGIEWTVQTSSWSGGEVVTDANLYQRKHDVNTGSGLYDELLLMNPFPAWLPGQVLEREDASLDRLTSAVGALTQAQTSMAVSMESLIGAVSAVSGQVDAVAQNTVTKMQGLTLRFE